ncbi:hypothetical protein, partial [Anaerotignum sp.]
TAVQRWMEKGMVTMRLIDADAKELNESINRNFGAVTRFVIKNILKNAPSIETKLVHSRWKTNQKLGKDYKQCACCKYDFARLYPDNFCPNCGARMDGE